MMPVRRISPGESGSALLLAFIALSLLSVLGLFMSLQANTSIQLSDNYETQIQATYAALAGLNHARALIRGIPFDDLLRGPDGTYSNSPSYLNLARAFAFRNPVPLAIAQRLNISSPDFEWTADDGLISTGAYAASSGTILIPMQGIGLFAPNPYGTGQILTSRYFVKITDNNNEASEIAVDPGNDPFVDGDGIVIVRSAGLSRTFGENAGTIRHLNSVTVFESRLQRHATFEIGPAIVAAGSEIHAAFNGECLIDGDVFPGIGTIDVNTGDSFWPDQSIEAAAFGHDCSITGAGQPSPSVEDITARINAAPGQSRLLQPDYLWKFVHSQAPGFADSYFDGDQYWTGDSAPYAGRFDILRPWNAPGQDPRITVVKGDLHLSGTFSGGGLLIVTGSLYCSGPYEYNGLVLVVGSGSLIADGSGQGITGGVLIATLTSQNGTIVFGTPALSFSGASRFISNPKVVKIASGLIPASEISFREIAGSDP